jgi:hypothetical protein
MRQADDCTEEDAMHFEISKLHDERAIYRVSRQLYGISV